MKSLTPKEELFVEHYCGTAQFNATQAADMAGYKDKREGSVILNRPHVAQAVRSRIEERKQKSWLSETQIMEKLWDEAHKEGQGTSHAARINALVWLGKHLGMWQEKKEQQGETQITYNIINYDNDARVEKITNAIEDNREEVEANVESASLPEGVVIASYAEPSKSDQE